MPRIDYTKLPLEDLVNIFEEFDDRARVQLERAAHAHPFSRDDYDRAVWDFSHVQKVLSSLRSTAGVIRIGVWDRLQDGADEASSETQAG